MRFGVSMTETSQAAGSSTHLVIAAYGSAAAAFLALVVTVMVPYLRWRGTDTWRRWWARLVVGRLPSDVHRWSLRFSVLDAWFPLGGRRRAERVIRRLERLYRCPSLPPCHHPQLCEECQATGGRGSELSYWLSQSQRRSAQRYSTRARRQCRERPWRISWQRTPGRRKRESISASGSPAQPASQDQPQT